MPQVDVVLLVATVIDLRGGAVATAAHGLFGASIGFSVGFGHGLAPFVAELAGERDRRRCSRARHR